MKYTLRALLSLPFAAATLVAETPVKSPTAQESQSSKGPLQDPDGVSIAGGLDGPIKVQRITETNVDVFAVRDDGCEQLLASGLDARELLDLQHWWRYTKPVGFDVKIVVRAHSLSIAAFSTTGTAPGLASEVRRPQALIS